MGHPALIAAITAWTAMASLAIAQQMKPAIRTAVCTAPHPRPGAAFSGPVLQVMDGRTLCVALGPDPRQWVRVQIDGAGRTRSDVMAAVFAQRLDCIAGADSAQGVQAVCRRGGVPLDRLLGSREAHAGDVIQH